MRKITIVGAGQAGLQLGIGLAQAGYAVTCVSNRTPEEIRGGRVTSSQIMFESARVHERALGINFWDATCPPIEGIDFGVSHAEIVGAKELEFAARFDRPAQSVDQRLKFPRWMEHFASLGGELRFEDATVEHLEEYARSSELVIVASGKGDLGRLFPRDATRSPYEQPKRTAAIAYVHGMPQRAEYLALRVTLVPDIGEFFVIPSMTLTGPCDIIGFEGIPGGSMDPWADAKTPGEVLARMKQIVETRFPWEAKNCARVELTDQNAVLTGSIAPTVRVPIAVLPSGRHVLGIGDTVVLNDPLTGQGSCNASKAATVYLAAIRERGDAPFDAAWMQATFDRAWDTARDATEWTNTLLVPPLPHVADLLTAATKHPNVARRFVNGFDFPEDLKSWFMTPEAAAAYLREVAATA